VNLLDYKKLCSECEKILASTSSTINTISISWLHIVREHPILLRNYYDVVDTNNSWNFFTNSLKKFIRYHLSFFKNIIQALNNGSNYWYCLKPLSKKTDLIFVTHLVNEAHINESEDFYYGNLPQKMHEKGLTILVVYINHTSKSEKFISQKWERNSGPNKLILSSKVGVNDEIKIYKNLSFESKRIKLLISKNLKNLKKKVLKRSSIEAFSGSSRSALRVSFQIEELIRCTKPKALITLFEGHAFERVIFKTLLSVNSNIIRVAYMHSIFFPFQHAIKQKISSDYYPDILLTSGLEAIKRLKHHDSFNKITLDVLGSNKNYSPRDGILLNVINNRKSDKATCLVLAEGYLSESIILFEYALKCAIILPNINFIFRLHPILNYKKLLTHSKPLKKLPLNVIFSNKDLDDEIELSSWALYRGTTAIFRAVQNGLMPIHYDKNDEISIDPLFNLKTFKKRVSSSLEFKEVIVTSQLISKDFWMQSANFAKNYCNGFSSPLNPDVLSGLLIEQNDAK